MPESSNSSDGPPPGRVPFRSIAEVAAAVRVLHQTMDGQRKILVDPIAARLVSPATCEATRQAFQYAPPTYPERIRALYVLRYRFAEDRLAEAYKDGIRQYVILGAGFDTFPYRQPAWAREMRIFEVDHPAMQQLKRERLRDGEIEAPSNLGYVAVDFDQVSPLEALAAAGFEGRSPAFFSLIGVSHFLTEASLDAILMMVRAMPPSSRLVFTFALPESELPREEIAMVAMNRAASSASGEPWHTFFRPEELKAKLAAMGFSRVDHTSKQEMDRRYMRYRHDGIKTFAVEQMMMVTV
jgi:methyltransferase (TIGR00027 family)